MPGNVPGGSQRYPVPSLWRDKPSAWHEVMPGVKRRILASSPAGMMVLYNIRPGSVFPLHSHAHAQYGVFLEGRGTFKVEGKKWSVGKGDSYYVPPGVRHELSVEGNETSIIIDFFTPERKDYLPEAAAPDE